MKSLIIVPVYSEEQTVRPFFEILRALYKEDVLAIDDGSQDSTPLILEKIKDERILIYKHTKRKGYGATLIRGFDFAINRGYQKIITIDCDLQHSPEDIPLFLNALDDCEVALGSRYIDINPEEIKNIPQDRLTINQYIASLINYLFKLNLTDPFCGFRGYRNSFLKEAALREKGYGLGVEIILEVIRLNARFKEVPIKAIYLNTTRMFLANLNDPKRRLLYYLDIISRRKKEFYADKFVPNYKSSSR